MITPKFFEGLNEQIIQLVGEGPLKTQEELKKNVNVMLQAAFSRLDLVTREEFDAQNEVLLRTRTMLEQLQKQVASLEAQQNAPENKG